MKLRILPIATTAVVSVTLLFGGWFAYRHYGVEQPLDRAAAKVPGVESAHSDMSADGITLKVKLSDSADLAHVYRTVKEEGARSIGSKSLKLVAEAPDNESLEKIWRSALFDVAQAMDRKEYTGIRDAMAKLESQTPGLKATTEIDEENVYVSLRLSGSAKYVILPRQGEQLEVWPNA
ncbi:hypothetical protein [Cohnella sp. JJ-181]|uniref:hypothetical protein n=1 Tax=Cohnella rhizoplanae TaxID=2974897 RepID=UPI0022FF5815|nr:hypothetical protein [Cohnella sp. JJ-181]CAI6081043.1 hypothetical protein COHCIP112018_03180 [Cohnella sp. JJ-181]